MAVGRNSSAPACAGFKPAYPANWCAWDETETTAVEERVHAHCASALAQGHNWTTPLPHTARLMEWITGDRFCAWVLPPKDAAPPPASPPPPAFILGVRLTATGTSYRPLRGDPGGVGLRQLVDRMSWVPALGGAEGAQCWCGFQAPILLRRPASDHQQSREVALQARPALYAALAGTQAAALARLCARSMHADAGRCRELH